MPSLNSHYNILYHNKFPFGSEPIEIVKKALRYKQSGMALDCGNGDGRHSIFFARNGFTVTAVDTSSVAIQKLRDIAKKEKLAINGIIDDITKFPFKEKYDAVILAFVLHHLAMNAAETLIQKIFKLNFKSRCFIS